MTQGKKFKVKGALQMMEDVVKGMVSSRISFSQYKDLSYYFPLPFWKKIVWFIVNGKHSIKYLYEELWWVRDHRFWVESLLPSSAPAAEAEPVHCVCWAPPGGHKRMLQVSLCLAHIHGGVLISKAVHFQVNITLE
jgi:hypothetical protein